MRRCKGIGAGWLKMFHNLLLPKPTEPCIVYTAYIQYADKYSLSIKKGSWWTVLQARHLIALCWKNASFHSLGLWLKHLISSLVLEKKIFYDIWEVFLDFVKVEDIKQAYIGLMIMRFVWYEQPDVYACILLFIYVFIHLILYYYHYYFHILTAKGLSLAVWLRYVCSV